MRRRWWLLGAFLLLVALGVWAIGHEIRTSSFQAKELSRIARQARFEMGAGPSPSIRFPTGGPFDERLGYTRIPDFVARLSANGFGIDRQARHSEKLAGLEDWGINPIYPEKTRAGLTILGRYGRPFFNTRFPEHSYAHFGDVPPVLVRSLAFVENREVLDDRYPKRNPAIEWDRLGRAALSQVLQVAGRETERAGGSTLATQIEKFRHSSGGLTTSPLEKLRQMASASLRAYADGPETGAARRRIVVDYLNSIPLAAAPPQGEVIGIGDALETWYDADFEETNRLLREADDASSSAPIEARARAYKQALSLVLSAGRPSYYLIQDPEALRARTDTYLHLLRDEGIISPQLCEASLGIDLEMRPRATAAATAGGDDRKSANAVRAKLVSLLGLSDYYALDRLDLQVASTVNAPVQEAITQQLRELRDPERAKSLGLYGRHMLDAGDPAKIVYSFSLYERGATANDLLVQADNLDQPFDVNEGVKLDLGSTAKLRTLATYLEIVAELHERFAGEHLQTLKAVETDPKDRITRFVLDDLIAHPGLRLDQLIEDALDRKYSASPAEAFFTGGGVHHFANFEKEDDSRILTVRESFTRSVNLVFIRLMRDIVNYYTYQAAGSSAAILRDPHDPRRTEYLKRFADREGRIYLERFWRKYHGQSRQEMVETLVRSVRRTPKRVAMALRAARPDDSFEEFDAALRDQLPEAHLEPTMRQHLYDTYSPAKFSLADQGYLAGVHPLELWLVEYLMHQPDATLRAVIDASADERIAVYNWLFSRHRRAAQDRRIRSLLEIEAFLEVHRNWQQHGYPFDTLVPSLATAIGSAADRPAALAEMAGIIANEGVRQPTERISELRFAADTPYETVLSPLESEGVRVMPVEVARALRTAMVTVVESGTAVRARNALVAPDGRHAVVGGKTGTGDHRFKTFGPGGTLLESRVVNRTATFVFLIDERFYGVITAYVHGPDAAAFAFTSSLPAQLFRMLAPTLSPLLAEPPHDFARRGTRANG
ncbi:MAG TPA: transglycosylase domain-containing protein [Myxococcota bacterium]|nr:transglycosylase domain-containing protein [Myxococcota bacterium]